MPYAVAKDIEDRYGAQELENSVARDEDGELDLTALVRALESATSLIDSYLARRGYLPLTTIPDTIVQACVDIALYICASGPGSGLTETKETKYKTTIKWLRDLADGRVMIGLPETVTADEDLPVVSCAGRVFSRAKMRGL